MNYLEAISFAETGGETNPWIRTKVIPEGGSTAFGPAQITASLIKDALNRGKLSQESSAFAQQVMLPMQSLFAKFGNEEGLTEEEKVFDYGGTGGFDPDIHGEAYNMLANELIGLKLEGTSTINDFLKKWRGKEPETGYRKRFEKKFKRSHNAR